MNVQFALRAGNRHNSDCEKKKTVERSSGRGEKIQGYRSREAIHSDLQRKKETVKRFGSTGRSQEWTRGMEIQTSRNCPEENRNLRSVHNTRSATTCGSGE